LEKFGEKKEKKRGDCGGGGIDFERRERNSIKPWVKSQRVRGIMESKGKGGGGKKGLSKFVLCEKKTRKCTRGGGEGKETLSKGGNARLSWGGFCTPAIWGLQGKKSHRGKEALRVGVKK